VLYALGIAHASVHTTRLATGAGQPTLRRAVPDAPQAERCLHQGPRTAAYELLASIYAWFIEGFDTTDLQEAGALLGALRA
jgi:hypothetical protein